MSYRKRFLFGLLLIVFAIESWAQLEDNLYDDVDDERDAWAASQRLPHPLQVGYQNVQQAYQPQSAGWQSAPSDPRQSIYQPRQQPPANPPTDPYYDAHQAAWPPAPSEPRQPTYQARPPPPANPPTDPYRDAQQAAWPPAPSEPRQPAYQPRPTPPANPPTDPYRDAQQAAWPPAPSEPRQPVYQPRPTPPANPPTDPYRDGQQAAWPPAQSEPRQPVYQPRPLPPANPPTDPYDVIVPGLGPLRGRMGYKIIRSRPVNAFLGIKYGQVGDGLARFQKASEPISNPTHVIDATKRAPNCPQWPELQRVTEDEARGINVDDCLTLDIYAPERARSLAVLVFVHGEMLFDGSAEEGQPDYFLEHDVVLVSINYRLAPFGFLTTLTDELPGNVALADIHLALNWVHKNIQAFGGNPGQVTLFGQAAGANLVHALSLSGKAEGLFQKLILQSGSALNPYFIDEDPISTIRSFARLARCPSTGRTPQSWNNCFSSLRTSELLSAFKQHWEANERRGVRFTGGFKLVVGDRLGYLPQHPAALVANNKVPTIAGAAKDAGAFILSRFYDQVQAVRSPNITDYIDVVLRHTAPDRHHQAWKNWALREIFTPEDIRNPTPRSLSQGLLELVNLILYRSPVLDSIRYTAKTYPTYLYTFDYRGEFHRFGHLDNPLPFGIDATLSDDNIYLFPYPEEVSQLNPEDKTIARALITMWVNFAENGVPNPNPGVWPRVSTEYGPFLRITNSRANALEVDPHFGEGQITPNVYPEYFTTTTTTTSTTARPIQPYANYNQYNRYPNNYYQNNEPRTPAPNSNYRYDPRYGTHPQNHTQGATSQYAKNARRYRTKI